MGDNTFDDLLVKTLAGAGWKKTYRGEKLNKPEMEFNNGEVTLQIGTRPDPGWITLAIFDEPEEGSDFALECPDNLADVLKTVISHQDKISFDDYKQFLSALVQVCPKTYVDTGDDFVPLIDNDDDDQ
jgi:hypothetical protein